MHEFYPWNLKHSAERLFNKEVIIQFRCIHNIRARLQSKYDFVLFLRRYTVLEMAPDYENIHREVVVSVHPNKYYL